MLDDIDGSAATQTVPSSLDGISYELDLSDDNATNLRDELARYLAVAQRTGGRKVRVAVGQSATGTGASTPDRERSRQIRAWAIDNGYPLSDRGRIPGDVVSAYEQAKSDEANAEKPAKSSRKRAPKKVAVARRR